MSPASVAIEKWDLCEYADLWLDLSESGSTFFTASFLLISKAFLSFLSWLFLNSVLTSLLTTSFFLYLGQKLMQVMISVLDFDADGFLSLDCTLDYRNFAPMGLKASSFYNCMFGTDADKPFADTLSSLCFDLYGRQFRLSPLTKMLQLSTLLFFKIPKDCCVIFIKASSFFWIAKGDRLFSHLLCSESSFLLRMTCLFLRKICLSMTKQLWMLLIYSSLLFRC